MRKALTLAAVVVCWLTASAPRSEAAFTIGDWEATPTQTVGDTTWVLTGTDLPTSLGVDLVSAVGLRIQNESGLLSHPASYTLDYTVSLSGVNRFTGVTVDTTTFGSSQVTKSLDGGVISVTSVDGNPSALTPIPGFPSSLTIDETITIGQGSVVTAFADSYSVSPFIAPVPDSGSAATLLLISMPLLLIGQFRSTGRARRVKLGRDAFHPRPILTSEKPDHQMGRGWNASLPGI